MVLTTHLHIDIFRHAMVYTLCPCQHCFDNDIRTTPKDQKTVNRHMKRWGKGPDEQLHRFLKQRRLNTSVDSVVAIHVADSDPELDHADSDHADSDPEPPEVDHTTRQLSRELLKAVNAKHANEVGIVTICKAFQKALPEVLPSSTLSLSLSFSLSNMNL